MNMDNLTAMSVTLVILVAQGWVLYMAYEMWKFTKKYNKEWGVPYAIFGVAMSLAFLRRIIVIWYFLEMNGPGGKIIQWMDHLAIPVIHTACWVAFLLLLRRWWKHFFDRYMKNLNWAENMIKREDAMDIREAAVSKREEIVKEKEKNA